MDLPPVAGRQQHFQKVRLGQWLPTGEGHAAAGFIVKQGILFDLPDQIIHADDPPYHFMDIPGGRVSPHWLWRRIDAFGIVTPGTAQRAPFKENGGADAGPVVEGIFLDFENRPRRHGIHATIHP